jgi:hypothetical protein
MTTAHAGRWRWERTAQRPTSDASGGRGPVTTETLWSNRPLRAQARLLEPKTVCCL